MGLNLLNLITVVTFGNIIPENIFFTRAMLNDHVISLLELQTNFFDFLLPVLNFLTHTFYLTEVRASDGLHLFDNVGVQLAYRHVCYPDPDEIFLRDFGKFSDSSHQFFHGQSCDHYALNLAHFDIFFLCSPKIYASDDLAVYDQIVDRLWAYNSWLYHRAHLQAFLYVFVNKNLVSQQIIHKVFALSAICGVLVTTFFQIAKFILCILYNISQMGRLIRKNTKFVQIKQSIIINQLWIYGRKPFIMFFDNFLGIQVSLPLKLSLSGIVMFNDIPKCSIFNQHSRFEPFICQRISHIALVKPFLDTSSFEAEAIDGKDWVFHHLLEDRAQELIRHGFLIILLIHLLNEIYQLLYVLLIQLTIQSSGSIFKQRYYKLFDSTDMIAAQRVEALTTAPLLQTYSSCLGLVTVDSYLYIFYPNTIRVYENFPHQLMPELLEQLIVSQRKIVRFAVSSEYIVMLYEDSKLEVRSRGYWQRVIYSFNLPQGASEINLLKVVGKTIIYHYYQEKEKSYIYGFAKLNHRPKETLAQAETMFWSTSKKFDQMITLEQLGNIENFYFGLAENEIHFGTFYKLEGSQVLQSFQFGQVKQENKANKVLSFTLLNCQDKDTKIKDQKEKPLYLVKLIEQNTGLTSKLVIKYYIFYQDQASNSPQQKNLLNSQQKRIQAYSKMMSALLQIKGNKEEQNEKESGNERRSNSKSIEVLLDREQKYSHCVHHKDFLYFATNLRIFRFSISDSTGAGNLQQLCHLQKGTKFIEACQNKLYLAISNIYVASPGKSNGHNTSSDTKLKQKNKDKNDQEIQTEAYSDVLLDQIEEKQLSSMIDGLFQKKSVADVEIQTEPYVINEKKQQEVEGLNKVQELPQAKRTYNSKSVGENFPICPNSHEQTLQKISTNLLQIQNNLRNDMSKKIQQMLRKQQDKTKNDINRKIEQLVGTAISTSVIPLIEVQVRQVFQAKLQEVNVYLYTLAMENLLHLKQEIQKDEAKENMLRTELIRKQLHEVSESKKAVSQMVEICKKREIQKIIFFEEIKKKFMEVEKKVLYLEQKVKALIEGEQINEAKLYDEIEIIKVMLRNQGEKNQSNRKKSTISQDRDLKIEEEKAESDSEEQESAEQNESQEEYESLQQSVSEVTQIVHYQTIRASPQHGMTGPYPPSSYYSPYYPPYAQKNWQQPYHPNYPQYQPKQPYQPSFHPSSQYMPPYQPYQYQYQYRMPPMRLRESPILEVPFQHYGKIREKQPTMGKETQSKKSKKKEK